MDLNAVEHMINDKRLENSFEIITVWNFKGLNKRCERFNDVRIIYRTAQGEPAFSLMSKADLPLMTRYGQYLHVYSKSTGT